MLTEQSTYDAVRVALIRHGAPVDAAGVFHEYLTNGYLPGDFMTGVLENDLARAVGHADSHNVLYLRQYVYFMYNELPADAWGSKQKVRDWVKQRHEARRSAAVRV